ncbi:Hypothetical protein, putative [Bodo saltans]|uniref:Uncharacterized protein n=1 Tax=Bodo saltans TaxID=75058 RepID=A0A0S4JPY8_BODSA|nr:Hypothetical protein, putative [Bodo saltans]|eukprot:CUG91141.1 Hypothetical protein, putative [Bodo saltans]
MCEKLKLSTTTSVILLRTSLSLTVRAQLCCLFVVCSLVLCSKEESADEQRRTVRDNSCLQEKASEKNLLHVGIVPTMGNICSCLTDGSSRQRDQKGVQKQRRVVQRSHEQDLPVAQQHQQIQQHPTKCNQSRKRQATTQHSVPLVMKTEAEILHTHTCVPPSLSQQAPPAPATQSGTSHSTRVLEENRSISDTMSSGTISAQHRSPAVHNPLVRSISSQHLIPPFEANDDTVSSRSNAKSSSTATGGTLSLAFDGPLGNPRPTQLPPQRMLGVHHEKPPLVAIKGRLSLLTSGSDSQLNTSSQSDDIQHAVAVDPPPPPSRNSEAAQKMISFTPHQSNKTYEGPLMVFDDLTSVQGGGGATPSLDGFMSNGGGGARIESFLVSSGPIPSPSHHAHPHPYGGGGGGRRSPSYTSTASPGARDVGVCGALFADTGNVSMKSDVTGFTGVGGRSTAASSIWSTGGGVEVTNNNNQQIEPGRFGLAKFHTR